MFILQKEVDGAIRFRVKVSGHLFVFCFNGLMVVFARWPGGLVL